MSRWSQLERLRAAWGLSGSAAPPRSGEGDSAAAYQAVTEPATKGCNGTLRSDPFEVATKVLTRDEHAPICLKREVFLKDVINYRSFILEAHPLWLAILPPEGPP